MENHDRHFDQEIKFTITAIRYISITWCDEKGMYTYIRGERLLTSVAHLPHIYSLDLIVRNHHTQIKGCSTECLTSAHWRCHGHETQERQEATLKQAWHERAWHLKLGGDRACILNRKRTWIKATVCCIDVNFFTFDDYFMDMKLCWMKDIISRILRAIRKDFKRV